MLGGLEAGILVFTGEKNEGAIKGEWNYEM
jgi:hypothetical protein